MNKGYGWDTICPLFRGFRLYECSLLDVLYSHFIALFQLFRTPSFFADPEAHGRAYFGEGLGDIYIENVHCNGSESHLEECPFSDVGDHDCDHSEDAGVSCQGMEVHVEQHSSEHLIILLCTIDQ